jgi:hypothetical protein
MTHPQLALRELAERYALAVDSRSPADLAALFTSDGRLLAHNPDGSVLYDRAGPEELVEQVDDLRGFTSTFHLVANHVAEAAAGAAGDTATAVVYCEAHHYTAAEHGGGSDLVCLVRYEDTCRKVPGAGWRIARREVYPQWYEQRTFPGLGG